MSPKILRERERERDEALVLNGYVLLVGDQRVEEHGLEVLHRWTFHLNVCVAKGFCLPANQ